MALWILEILGIRTCNSQIYGLWAAWQEAEISVVFYGTFLCKSQTKSVYMIYVTHRGFGVCLWNRLFIWKLWNITFYGLNKSLKCELLKINQDSWEVKLN